MREDADEKTARLADSIKSVLETERITIDVAELERQKRELK